ncbi:MAG: hypothetical protein KDN22_09030 [Verrucomicrobiae bacterium]|nr:hypothetical protein [Verrucomicrobiae bacterium]
MATADVVSIDGACICNDGGDMRTTVTIGPDAEILLSEEVRGSGRSFKKMLARSGEARAVEPIFGAPFPAELEGGSMNHLSELLDDDRTVKELGI